MKSYPFSTSNQHVSACTEVVSVALAMFVGLALAGLTSLPAFAPAPYGFSGTTIVQVLPGTPVVTTAPLVATVTTAATEMVTSHR